ncbi:MAG: hypothetical protein H5T34_01605 [Candidatus Methanomethyliales bacterium]|nr:hypothetical protein [Candidatus Methanomethylicales archaeon]
MDAGMDPEGNVVITVRRAKGAEEIVRVLQRMRGREYVVKVLGDLP